MIAVEKLIVFWPMWLSLQCARVMMRSGRAMIVWIMRGTCSYIIILFTTNTITQSTILVVSIAKDAMILSQ